MLILESLLETRGECNPQLFAVRLADWYHRGRLLGPPFPLPPTLLNELEP